MERSLIQLPFLVVIIIVGVTPTIILPSFSSSPLSDLKSNLGNNNSDDDNGEDDSDNGNGNDGDSERAVPSESRNTDNDNEEGAGGLIEQQQWLTYENSKYGIKVQYPSGWNLKEGDRFPGDYETDIVRFYPPDVGDFSEDEFSDKERPSVVLKLSIYSLTPIEGDIDLDTYLDDVINGYLEEDSDIIEWNTDANLAGQHAYNLIVSGNTPDKGGNYKEMLTGTIVDDKDYYILYTAKPKEYDNFLPTAQKIIDSYQMINRTGTGLVS